MTSCYLFCLTGIQRANRAAGVDHGFLMRRCVKNAPRPASASHIDAGSGTAGVVSSTTDYKPQLVKTTAEKDYRDRLNPTGHVNIHFYTEKRPVTKNEYDLASPFTIDIK